MVLPLSLCFLFYFLQVHLSSDLFSAIIQGDLMLRPLPYLHLQRLIVKVRSHSKVLNWHIFWRPQSSSWQLVKFIIDPVLSSTYLNFTIDIIVNFTYINNFTIFKIKMSSWK
jgi:hypothetical protein